MDDQMTISKDVCTVTKMWLFIIFTKMTPLLSYFHFKIRIYFLTFWMLKKGF